MLMTKTSVALIVCAAFTTGFIAHALFSPVATVHAAGNRVFEIRTYTTPPGKLEALKARFRDHTIKVFDKYDMKSIGYWVPQDAPLKDNTLIYIISHANRDQAKKNWADFSADEEWKKVSTESQVNGRIVTKVESVFADATDYSPMK